MGKLSLKAKTVISVCAFIVIFAVLLTMAALYDYQISEILTKNTLAPGQYHAYGAFGVVGEIVGTNAVYLFIMFATCVLFWFCIRCWDKKPYNIIVAVICFLLSWAASVFIYHDAISYIFDQVNRVTGYVGVAVLDELRHSGALYVAIPMILGLFTDVPLLFAVKQFKDETLKKLAKFALAGLVATVVALIFTATDILKGNIGRMRFRAINSDLGAGFIQSGQVQGYTPWYKINHQPNEEILAAFQNGYSVKDAFKSFPSGHTSGAAVSYCLIMIPSLFETKKPKLTKALCWIIPIVVTMLVAISRITVGAHYLGDVTMGGTLTFVSMIISREIFICKGEHFFAVFPKLKKNKGNDVKKEEVAETAETTEEN